MNHAEPKKLSSESPHIAAVLDLLHHAFAYMDPLINPPSSLHRLTEEKIRQQCKSGEVWTLGEPPYACVFFSVEGRNLYIGKLAVHETMRGQGIARRLVKLARERAVAIGLDGLMLETRIELVDNHLTFQRLGFAKTGEGAHEGYDRSTYIVMKKPLYK